MTMVGQVTPTGEDSPGFSRSDRRLSRWDALHTLWSISSQSRVRGCRRIGVLADGGVAVRVTGVGDGKRAGFAGLATCGSVWACPCCSEKILAGRQDEMNAALAAWSAATIQPDLTGAGRVAMVTLTMRHRDGQALDDLWDGLTYAWGRVTSGRRWGAVQAAHGADVERVITRGVRRGELVTEKRIGFIKVVETTHGKNGWHVHVHAALFLPATISGKDVDALGCEMFQVWRDALQAKGFDAPLARHGGLDARLWDGVTGVDVYFTKNRYQSNAERFAFELGRPDLKLARGGNRTPFQILADIADGFLAADGDLWAEWERVSHGRRQVSWSFGLRARLLPDVAEQSDDELAAATIEGEAVVVITRAGVKAMSRRRLGPVILDTAETATTGGLVAVLDHYGVEWVRPDTANLRDTRPNLHARLLV